jgi:hypothetical protein
MSYGHSNNRVENACIFHLFDGNLEELCAFLQTHEKFMYKKVVFKLIRAHKG